MIHGLYGLVATDELDESFYALLPLMQGAVVESKQRSILATWAYMAGKANVNGIEFGQKDVLEPGVPEIKQPTPGFDVNPWLLNAPNAASGMSISEINARAPYGVKALIKQGMPPKQALRVSEGRMIALSKTESPLMSRLIPGTVVETRAVTGFARYRRVPAPGACDYCLAQAQRGAVFHSEQLAQGSHLPGGGYHMNCRCTTQLITDVDEKNAIAIHPDDMRKIETKFDRKGRVWKTDLNSNWNQYRNRPESRPPDIEFLPLQSVE